MGRSDEMDGRRCSSAGQIIDPFKQYKKLPTIKWAAEMPPFFIGQKMAHNRAKEARRVQNSLCHVCKPKIDGKMAKNRSFLCFVP